MKLSERHIAKTDDLLRDALEAATGEETICAVMVLAPDAEERAAEGVETPSVPQPSEFPSRAAYRQALIERRQAATRHGIGKTKQDLANLSLNPRGGEIGATVVVEGPASRVLASLDLPGVRHASLDRRIDLVKPRRD